MALSLFGGKKHLHHFVAEQDVAKELFALLVEAKTMYLRDVVTGNKQYYRYVEDFVNSHRYIDCDHAVCRNCHEMNIHIVKGAIKRLLPSYPSIFYRSRLLVREVYGTETNV